MLEEVQDKVAMKKTEVCEWHECFQEDHDDPFFGRLSTSTNDENIECVCAMLFEVTDERVFRRYQRKLDVGSTRSILHKDSNGSTFINTFFRKC
jgi:hypothetical protein